MKMSKKIIGATIIISLGLTSLQPSFAYAVSNNQSVEVTNQIEDSVKKVDLPSVSEIEEYIQNASVEKDNHIMWNVETKEDLFRVLDNIHTELPNKVLVISSISKEDAKKWFTEYEELTIPSKTTNIHTLASYSLKKTTNKLITIRDDSNKKYSAKQIETGIKDFSREFSKKIEHLDTNQKIKVIYDYIYSQYRYKAKSYTEMLVGNAYTKEMACNGFSRLFYELSVSSGIHAKIIESNDHFYNHVQISNGEWIIIDLTTDILLKTKYGATGLSNEDYLNYVKKVGFYSAMPVSRETAISTPLTIKDKELFISTIIPSLSY